MLSAPPHAQAAETWCCEVGVAPLGIAALSLHLDVRIADHRRPFGEFRLHMGSEFLGRGADDLGAEFLHPLGDLRVGERLLGRLFRRATTSGGVFAGAKSAFQV